MRINTRRISGIITLMVAFNYQVLAIDFSSMEELSKAYPPSLNIDLGKALLEFVPEVSDSTMAVNVTELEKGPFANGLSVDVKKPGNSPYGVRLTFSGEQEWLLGETGLLAFYCRMVSTENPYGSSSMLVQYKPDDENWRSFITTDLFLKKDWQLVTMPFEVTKDTAGRTSETVLNIFLGGVDPQVVELAGLRVLGYGDSIPVKALPVSSSYYPGIEADAAWRKAANQRIEKHRKGSTQVQVVDAQGNPLARSNVSYTLKRHRFGFGAAIITPKLFDEKVPENERKQYSDILTRTCSKITPTNAMKWRQYERLKEYVEPMVRWGNANDMTLRGHLLVWPGFERLPDGYDLHEKDPEAFRKAILQWIDEHVNRFPDAFAEWDVMNEPYTEHAFMDLLGKEEAVRWFNTARDTNGSYLNYINDFGILSDNNAEHRDVYYDWIQYLIDEGAALDGIGFQGHFRTAIPPELIMERIDRYAAFGKKMQITEFDFDHTDKQLQARFFEDFVTLIYSHPQMEALINWMYLEDPFRPDAALYAKDFSPTPMGSVWEHLLTERWHSQGVALTDEEGNFQLEGYKGIYEIRVGDIVQTIDLGDEDSQTLIVTP